jgi:hypothetical protein
VAKGLELTFQGGYETPLKEVKEIVVLPELNTAVSLKQMNANSIVLSVDVCDELHKYIQQIALLYNSNPCMYSNQNSIVSKRPFTSAVHNFEHARYVVVTIMNN